MAIRYCIDFGVLEFESRIIYQYVKDLYAIQQFKVEMFTVLALGDNIRH